MKKLKKKKKEKAIYKPKPGKPSRFPKGVSGNPDGRPKGSKNHYSIAELWHAIERVEKKKSKSLLEAFAEQAYDNSAIMTALMKKLLPDLKAIEGLVATFESSMSDEMAKLLQDKLKERY